MSQAFFLEQWPELLARVPNLRIFARGEPRNLHGKMAVFDAQIGLVGTYNLDPLSMGVNSEVALVAWSEAFAHRLAIRPWRLLAAGPPAVYEYRIQRDGQGNARRDEQGKVMIAFGPEDHSSPEQWARLRVYWDLLKAAEQLPGFSPLL
jgi:phosphatidylserine/phosphatidylglycerophosphate/cardiolipin synthase-like enzyme